MSENLPTPAVEQQDVEPWQPLHIIFAGLVVVVAMDAVMFAICVWALRGIAC